jgi:hypothetical protein
MGPGEFICTPAGGKVGVEVIVGVREARGVAVALKLGVKVALGAGLIVTVCSNARGVGLFWFWVLTWSGVDVGEEAGGKSAAVVAQVGVADGVAVCPALTVSWTTVGM